MPIAAPIIAALITAGVSGTEMGLQASGAFGGGGGGGPSQADILKQQQVKDQKAQQDQLKQGFMHAAPDAQAQVGGSLPNEQFAAMVRELTGTGGNIDLAKQTIFGTDPSTTQNLEGQMPTLTPSAPGLSSTGVGG